VNRVIVEAPEFTKQLEELGDIRELDESLRAIMWGIQTQAEKFKLVPGFRTIRMAKIGMQSCESSSRFKVRKSCSNG
jgi:hypothetical protein